jgi:signal transduction histidine kinase
MKPFASTNGEVQSRVKAILKVLSTPPTFTDLQRNTLSQTLHYLLILAVIFAGGYGVLTSFIATEPSGTILSVSMMLIAMFLFWQLQKKRIKLVSTVLVISAHIAILTTLFINGGIRDEAALVLIALLSIAGFLLGMHVVVPLGVITAVLLIIVFFAERLELIPETEHLAPVAADELVLALIAVFVTTIILYQITRLMIRNTAQIEAQSTFLSERNKELKETQTALIVAKEEAEEANRSRTVFFSRMSHDLRAPLSGIVGMATHLLNDGPQLSLDERQEFLQGIQRSGTHLLALINDLLDISRLEAHQLQLHLNPTALYVSLSEVIMMLRLSAEEKGIDLRLQVDENIPSFVMADEQRLHQILINLVGNSIKFTRCGEVALLVTAVAENIATATIRFEVMDTGRGIASENLRKIFDPFIQVEIEKSQVPGTGLGLAICRQLVQVMGGTIQVESVVGQGSRFWFTLQLEKA